MHLSDGTIVGICYPFSFGLAQMWMISSAKGGFRRLWPALHEIPGMAVWSLFYAILAAAGIVAMDWAFKGLDHHPDSGLQLSIVDLLALAWVVTAVYGLAFSGANRLKQATGVDVIARARLTSTILGAAIGMILSGAYLFGGHLLRN